MADLLLKIDSGSNYEDGDILCAFNLHRILCGHAQLICSPKTANRNPEGLIRNNTLARAFMEATHQFRFERISSRQVRRRNLITGDTDIIGPLPNDNGEAMNVRLFITRRKRNPNHLLFGVDTREIWYGGRKDFSQSAIDTVWNAIETQTPKRKADHDRWPMGRLDMQSHLPVATEDFDNKLREDLVEPLFETDAGGRYKWVRTDENKQEHVTHSTTNPDRELGWEKVVDKKRRQNCDWQNMLEMTPGDLEKARNKGQQFDIRSRKKFNRSEIIRKKQRGQ